MNHFNGLGLENFRVFKKKQWFDFAPITILTGINSSGKSSLINAIEILTSEEKEMEEYNSLSHSMLFSKVPALKHFKFSKYRLYSRKLSKRLGDFSTFQSDKSADIHIYYRSNLKINDQIVEIRLTYNPTGNLVKIGELKKITIVIPDDLQIEILSISVENKAIHLSVNYDYFLQSFYTIFSKMNDKDRLDISDSINVYNLIANKQEEIDLLIEAGINYFQGNGESLYKYGFKSELYIDENEGEHEEFTKVKNEFKELYKDEINRFKSIKSFFTTYEKRLLNNYSVFISGNSLNNENLLRIIQILSDPIKRYPRKKNFELNDSTNPVELFLHLKYTHAEMEDDIKKFPYWFFNSFVGGTIVELLTDINYKKGVFLKPNRAEVQRSYNDADNLENLQSISNQIYRLQTLKSPPHRVSCGIDPIGFINFSLKLLEIGDEILFKRNSDDSSTLVYIKHEEKEELLADVGFGVSQVLSFIFEIALKISAIGLLDNMPPDVTDQITDFYFEDIYSQGLIIIEEPESNLHPANQSRLADIIVKATKTFGIQFIIETHSEYLIRKLQYLTAKGEQQLKPEDSIIYYFHHPDKVPAGEKQVKKINIQADGSLTDDFGTGFFDEAMNLKFELLELRNPQKN
jgi:energy-coupling factor transporter ATP-binding protein EcfA2